MVLFYSNSLIVYKNWKYCERVASRLSIKKGIWYAFKAFTPN